MLASFIKAPSPSDPCWLKKQGFLPKATPGKNWRAKQWQVLGGEALQRLLVQIPVVVRLLGALVSACSGLKQKHQNSEVGHVDRGHPSNLGFELDSNSKVTPLVDDVD